MTEITDINDETISKAITDAFDFWLSQHPISFPEMIETAIEKSFSDWLMSNDVMERAIRAAATNWLRDHDAAETIAKAITDSKVKK
jgi:hypothetical protein